MASYDLHKTQANVHIRYEMFNLSLVNSLIDICLTIFRNARRM